MSKPRLDELLVERGLALDEKEAQALILRGVVLVEGQRCDKAGTRIDRSCSIRLKTLAGRYASRGGEKLEAVLESQLVDVHGKVCLDLGASTGGFTDCLLQHGARRVYALDVGRGLLAWPLRQNPRVVVLENFNARGLAPTDLTETPEFVSIDLSFISLRVVLPRLLAFGPLQIAALVKPQFEAAKDEVGEGGIIRDPKLRQEIVERVQSFCLDQGFSVDSVIPSPITGAKGNQEVFLVLGWNPLKCDD